MTGMQSVPVRTWVHGRVPEGTHELAVTKVRSALRHTTQPILSARVTLTMAADPAVARPAVAKATIDVNGWIVRAGAAGQAMPETIGHMSDRLRGRLGWTGHRRQAGRRHARSRRSGSCRADDGELEPAAEISPPSRPVLGGGHR